MNDLRHILDASISTEWVILVPVMKVECETMIWKSDDCAGIDVRDGD
jgi:hypothetical protein